MDEKSQNFLCFFGIWLSNQRKNYFVEIHYNILLYYNIMYYSNDIMLFRQIILYLGEITLFGWDKLWSIIGNIQ